jgi:hypothetical protein
MYRWPALALILVFLSGCQIMGGRRTPVTNLPCPDQSPCDEAEAADGPFAANRPFIPGCPSTLQVLLRPIVFHAVRPDPDATPGTDTDDLTCDAPEPPLLRTRLDPDGVSLARVGAGSATSPGINPLTR